MRAPARNPRWLNPAPCTSAKGGYLVGARKQVERTVDGDEHAESDGRPKNPSTNTGLSDVGISYDHPRAGRNARPYPRRFLSARCKTKPTCRPRPIHAAAEPWYPGDQRERN